MTSLPASSLLSGFALSGAALLAVAGAGKLLSGVGGPDSDSAIRRALGIGPRAWRQIEVAAAALECATATAVLTGLAPAMAGTVMAGQGAVFAGLLANARRVGAPGGCGCLGRRGGAEAVTWRSFARALWGARGGPAPGPGAVARPGCPRPAGAAGRRGRRRDRGRASQRRAAVPRSPVPPPPVAPAPGDDHGADGAPRLRGDGRQRGPAGNRVLAQPHRVCGRVLVPRPGGVRTGAEDRELSGHAWPDGPAVGPRLAA